MKNMSSKHPILQRIIFNIVFGAIILLVIYLIKIMFL